MTDPRITVLRPQRSAPLPPDGVLRRSFPVSWRTVTITMAVAAYGRGVVGQTRVQWSPDPPRRLSKAERRQYRAGRNALYQEVADVIGAAVAVAEV
jgi:hypothetical protein